MGEVDAAAAAGERVVRDGWNLRSGHVLTDIAKLAAAIAPFKAPGTEQFLDQASELLTTRGPAPATLPG